MQSDIDKLKELVSKYPLPLEDIRFEDDIQKWCEQHNVRESNPFRVAKILQNDVTQKYLILLRTEVTDDMVNSVKSRMFGIEDEAKILKTRIDFLKHTVLHEICHALNKDFSEEECDRWAFRQIDIL